MKVITEKGGLKAKAVNDKAAIENGTETAENVISQINESVREIIALEAGREHVSLAVKKTSRKMPEMRRQCLRIHKR